MQTWGSSGQFWSASRIAAPWAGSPQSPWTGGSGRGCNAKAHAGICFEGLTFWNELGLFVGS